MSYFNAPPSNNIYALKEVGPELERIRCRVRGERELSSFLPSLPLTLTPLSTNLSRHDFKATEKIRDFLIRKIEQLKAPNTNISIIQQSIFLKYKDLYAFLAERYKEAAMEVKMNYIYTVSNYYFASFEKYLKSMSKLQVW